LALALTHAERLLEVRPDLARDQAIEILHAIPGHPTALLILGTAHRLLGDAGKSCAVLLPLAKAMRQNPDVHFQFGLSLAESGDTQHAIAALRHCLDLKPDFGDGWRALADLYSQLGDDDAADDASARQIKASVSNALLLRAADALCDGKLAVAELILRISTGLPPGPLPFGRGPIPPGKSRRRACHAGSAGCTIAQ
jgi:predicted Zn-dependent protease